jgi:hypothetical protein
MNSGEALHCSREQWSIQKMKVKEKEKGKRKRSDWQWKRRRPVVS